MHRDPDGGPFLPETPPRRRRSRLDVLREVPKPYFGSGIFIGRVAALGVAAVALFSVLGLRLWALQVVKQKQFAQSATQQATRQVDLPAARGAIITANGVVLADATGSLVVSADASRLGSGSGSDWQPNAYGVRLLGQLAGLAGTDAATLIGRVRSDLVQNPFAPAIVLDDVPEPLASYLSERQNTFRGLSVSTVSVRNYPQGALGGAFLGLTGQIDTTELAAATYPWAHAGQIVGQSGVEANYDQILNAGFERGTVGVNARGEQVTAVATHGTTRDPGTLQLTINLALQKAAQHALQEGIADAHRAGYPAADGGAAIVLNPQNGAIEALASAPQLNQAAAADDPSYLQRLLESTSSPSALYDQATQGLFPLGSTFKPVVAEAALSSGLITSSSTLPCVGSLTVGGIVFHNVESWIDETMNLSQALEISCDTWFYQLGEQLFGLQQHGDLAIQHWAKLFGFGQLTGIDMPGESQGVVPTPAWLEHTAHAAWYEGDSVNLSIGQGYLEATPLQLAVAYAALANGGTIVRPHLGEAVIKNGHRTVLSFPPVRHLKLLDLATIRQGLYLAAHAPDGTSSALFGNYPVAVDGKTGTAQIGNGNDDSWYASWAPANDPKVVVIVLIENGGYGADAAAPAARDIYDAYFHVQP